jgi:hypothetical protein
MGKKRGKPFKAGESGNPAGRPPIPADIRALKEQRKREVQEFLCAVYVKPIGEIEEIGKSKTVPMLQRILANFMRQADKTRDEKRVRLLLELAIGLKGQSEDTPPAFVPLVPLSGEQLTKALDALKAMKEKK